MLLHLIKARRTKYYNCWSMWAQLTGNDVIDINRERRPHLTGIDEFIGSPDMLLKMSQCLVYSAKKGNVKSAKSLIEPGIDVNASSEKDGLRALHAAANAGQQMV